MALNKSTLISDIKAVFKDIADNTDEKTKSEDIRQKAADGIADAVEKYVKSGTVTVNIPPLTVSQGTSPSVVPNPAAIPLTGDIS